MEQTEEKKEKLLGFLIDIEAGKAEPLFFEDSLQEFYRLLNCSIVDIQEALLEGTAFDFILDDEGMLKNSPKPSAFTKEGKPCFVGNLLICHADYETGKQTGLKEEDISLIYKHLVEVANSKDPTEPHFKAIKDLEF